ncbi:MAG TPA: LPS export ABC transporter ATP-binding protein [Capsulimonadaceae bacterium]|jgi:lipopolysaccharide export system ATP-binding protein
MQILAKNLVKSYKKRTVVNGISIEIHQGEIVGLLGPNGAGKTTTFYMLVGLIRADSGTVLLNGDDITHLPMYARAQRGIGYLAQENSVFRKLTTEENIHLVLEMSRGPEGRKLTPAQRRERADGLMEELGLTARRDTVAGLLSGGERRRVEIARVLATEPSFILLDEPFTGVDPLAIADLQKIIHDLIKRGIGVLITDHNVHATLAITDRAYIISEGEIKTSGASEKLVEDPIAQKFYLGEGFRL